jgi:superfamily I DNA/RNA helicase
LNGTAQVIVGCPGTGKTTYLAKLIAEYRRLATSPVVFCSHTRAAARAALDKDIANDPGVQVQTLHSFCFRHLGMSKAQVPDGQALAEFCASVGAPMGRVDGEEDIGNDLGDDYLSMLSLARARRCRPEEIYDASPRRDGGLHHFSAFVKSYDRWKDTHGFMDFSDMVACAVTLNSFGAVGLLVVDEAQDLTPVQWAVIDRIITVTGCDTIVAGDSDQAINAWAGADPMGMHHFEEQRGATRTVLPQSYRIPEVIHGLAEKVIERASVKIERTYLPRGGVRGEYRRLSDPADMDIEPGRDVLVLYPDRFQRKEVERNLIEAGSGYTAISGYPAPLDNRVGKAILAAHSAVPDEGVITRGLNARGRATKDSVGIWPIIEKIRKLDFGHLSVPPHLYDYYHRVPKVAPKIRISTIHGAKGLEADDVHLVTGQSRAAQEQAWIDADSSHRLFYVAVTRTRDRLFTYEADGNYDLPEIVA